MKKITPEQRDFLIQQFMVARSNLTAKGRADGGMFHELECRAVINSCTDVPFPDFELVDEINTHRYSVNLGSDGWIRLLNSHGHESKLSPDEFKTFTEGCNKIVEWIDEQDYKASD